ncbi:MAG: hypothetical protein ACRDJO_09660 [Actinomycetota bacterium]
MQRAWRLGLALGMAAAAAVPSGVAAAGPGPDWPERRQNLRPQAVGDPALVPTPDPADGAADADETDLGEAQTVQNAAAGAAGEPAAAAASGEIPLLACSAAGSGIWGGLDGDRHDNLTVTTDAAAVVPGQPVTLHLTWEWRDWRPGAPLAVRVCLSADPSADGRAGRSMDFGPVDLSVVHPETEPATQVRHRSGSMRAIVTEPLQVTVPASMPPGGEFCIRTAVTGLPDDHRASPPLLDVSDSLCRPVVAPAATPPPETPPPAEVLGEEIPRVTPDVLEIPVTGAPIAAQATTGVLLILSGLGMTGAGRRRLQSRDAAG